MRRLALNGVELSWRDEGVAANVVLFIHGFPFSSAQWAPQLAQLPPTWRGIAPDLRGFGDSSGSADAVYTMEGHARDLLALLDHLGCEQAVVCGLSMGGYIALALHRIAPERIFGLVLCDTRAEPDTVEGRAEREALAGRVRREGAAVLLETMLPKLLAPVTFQRRPEVVAAVEEMIRGTSAGTLERALLGLAQRPDARPQLSGIAVPTLVLGGEEDEITPAATLRELAAAVPGAELRLLAGAGHVSSLEAADDFNAALFAFLAPLTHA